MVSTLPSGVNTPYWGHDSSDIPGLGPSVRFDALSVEHWGWCMKALRYLAQCICRLPPDFEAHGVDKVGILL